MSDLQTIFFARSRNQTEVLLKYLRDECKARQIDQDLAAKVLRNFSDDTIDKVSAASLKIVGDVAWSLLQR